jgi:5-methylcytosine-specific restriction endonuclease McrA
LKRDRVFARDDYRCVYCGRQFDAAELSVDHVEPRVRGGDQSNGNLVTACRACNNLKGHRRVSEFLRENPEAHRNFLSYAVHLWPRLRRTLLEEIDEQPGTRD